MIKTIIYLTFCYNVGLGYLYFGELSYFILIVKFIIN